MFNEKDDDLEFIEYIIATGQDKEFFNPNSGKNKKESDSDNNKGNSNGGCYLTSACMNFYQENFDDNCYELFVLRWFRDNYVSKEDIKDYYNIAPRIVNEINKLNEAGMVYDYVYDNIVDYCVKELECGNYNEAYDRYKESILSLEKNFVKKNKVLSKKYN